MLSMIRNLRSMVNPEGARRAYLDRCQDADDPALHQRLGAAVDTAIAMVEPVRLDTETDDGVEHTCVWGTWGRRTVSAQRTTHRAGRVDHAIYVDGGHCWSDPDSGPWLVTLDGDGVRFMPGKGFDTPEAFLDWFEEGSL